MGFELFMVLVVAGLGLVIGIRLSQVDIKKGCRKVDGTLGLAFSLTPFPLYLFLFMIIAKAKGFTFI